MLCYSTAVSRLYLRSVRFDGWVVARTPRILTLETDLELHEGSFRAAGAGRGRAYAS